MAEALVFLVLKKIAASMAGQALDTISAEFGKEMSVLLQVKSSMKQIESEFMVMQAFISQVDLYDSRKKTLVAWSEQVKKVAFEVEDIIDEYTYLVGQESTYLVGEESVGGICYFLKNVGGICNFLKTADGICNFLKKAFRRSKNVAAWHRIATQLKEVETRLEKLTTMKDRYDISVNETGGSSISESAALRQRRVLDFPNSNDEDDKIVGNDAETKELIQWLTDGKEARTVISISGMGGLGKTMLANSIYKNPKVKRHFDWSIWISVSQSYRVEDLLRRILKHNMGKNEAIPNDVIDAMDRIELVGKVQIYLQEKKYLIVLDDVWSRDEQWSVLDRAFVKNNLGSRVIITTRKDDVVVLADENRRLRLSTLQKEEALDLFCKKAFSRLACCPQDLKLLADKIVDKCQGLPLAIVAIGSLLSYKEPQEREWKSFYNQLEWELTNNPELDSVVSILNLSYNDLPSYLKNCFLYCSLFPEDFWINREWLIRLWTAEGFIDERGQDTTMEEVADSYVKELVHRSMLQVVGWDDFGIAKTLQIHDLVREITLEMSRKEKFGIVCNSPGETMLSEQARRVSVHERVSALQPNASLRQLRSFILFNDQLPSSSIENTTSNFRLLRVLCMPYAKIEQIPDAVFDLFNLHYLDLRYTKVKSIPNSLGNLQSCRRST